MTTLRVTIGGASGLIGTALAAHLGAAGHHVTRLVRRTPGAGEAQWDPATGTIDATAIDGADAVVNLSGAGIGDHRWNAAYRETLATSRIAPTELLASTIAAAERKPAVLLSASAVGVYGASLDASFTEHDASGDGFLASLCRDWEAATTPASAAGVRVAFIRTGLVLAAHGGVLPRMVSPIKLFAGGPFGNGRQWMSWVSLDDEVRAITHLLAVDIEGPVDITSPNPVTNREFVATLGRVLRRPAKLPTPKLALRFALGRGRADALLLEGQRALPEALQQHGFRFDDPELEPTLRRLLRPGA
jgi:uncharacterized protein (TIGR01777 family)